MERTKRIKPSAILTSDWHLREDTPTCRTDDFWNTQWGKVSYIKELQSGYGCPVIHAGDLFDHWKPSPLLLSLTITLLPKEFYTVFGQHDIPQHNLELGYKSGVVTLENARVLTLLNGTHFGCEPVELAHSSLPTNIMVWHHMTYVTKPFPGATGGMAQSILRKYSQFDLIITGDNHCSFSVEHRGRLLVNPGNLTRQEADQADYQPRVALWYAESNTIEWVNIPIDKDVISREHIEQKEERDKRIDAFVNKLSGDWNVGYDFEHNLTKFEKKNKVDKEVMGIIYKAMDNERS